MRRNAKFLSSKLILLTILVFKNWFHLSDSILWINYCQEDFEFCPQCFGVKISESSWDARISSLEGDVNSIFGWRKVQRATWLTIDGRVKQIILKRSFNKERVTVLCEYAYKYFPEISHSSDCLKFLQIILDSGKFPAIVRDLYNFKRNNNGFTLCPSNSVESNFVETFNYFSNENTFWMQLWMNPELVILRAIQNSKNLALKNAVPEIIDWCGFVILEEDKGDVTLLDMYDAPLKQRIYLAKQLLEIAFAFSNGLNGFRFYLTDATPDNIAADRSTHRITFIDLDAIVIVNSNLIQSNKINRHQKIDCDRCFAYIPHEICAHHLSDINLFSVCEIFLADSIAGTSKGLLHTIPSHLDNLFSLKHLLNQCLYCDKVVNCKNRFHIANTILSVFNQILEISDEI